MKSADVRALMRLAPRATAIREGPDVQLGVREVASRIGRTPGRVQQMIHAGLLPAERGPRGWLIRGGDVAVLLSAGSAWTRRIERARSAKRAGSDGEKKALDVMEVAARIGRSGSRVRQLIAEGILPAERRGGRLKVGVRDVEVLLQGGSGWRSVRTRGPAGALAPAQSEPGLVSVREVAAQARCSEASVRELLRGGVVAGERIGGWWFLRAESAKVLMRHGPPWPTRGAVADAVRVGVDPATLLEVPPNARRLGVGCVGAAEAARRLRLPYKTVLARIASGELPARRVHGSWAVSEDALATTPRRMTIHEVADQLGVERQRVHQLIRDGRLAAIREGRLWLVEEGALEGLLHQVRG